MNNRQNGYRPSNNMGMYEGYGRTSPYDAKKPPEGMSLGQWIGTFLLLLIPVVNIIAFLVWLFGGGRNKTRVNFIRATLIFSLILSAISVIIFFFFMDKLKDLLVEYLPNVQSMLLQIKLFYH